MTLLVAVLLVLAVVFAVLRAFGVTAARVDLGWLAVACVVAAVWMIPAFATL